ncbi:MAG: CPBP family intramembrane metalloprotease [Bacteroidales bacterium]|nr:CPBP family intramembrane metalloprotease [Bacteroidales bacterium]
MSLGKWILCLICGFILFFILYAFAQLADLIRNSWIQMGANVLTAVLGVFLYAVWTNLTEHRPVTELALKRVGKDTGLGLLTGVLYFAVVAGLMALAGCYRITGAHFNFPAQLQAFCLFLPVAVFEEVLFRGIVFRMIDDRWNTVVALLISALIFGAIHLPNPGATLWSAFAIAVEAGVLLAAAYKYSGTLWLPIGIHWAWNYVQGNVLGFAVSGNPMEEKVFSAVIAGPDWLTGGLFGAEASVIAVVVGLLLAFVFLYGSPKERR